MRRSTKLAWLALAAWAVMGSAAEAQEQEPAGGQQEVAGRPPERRANASPKVGPLRLYGGLRLGLGGDLELDTAGIPGASNFDLKATVGAQVGVDYLIIKYLAMSGEFRIGWWNTSAADDLGLDRSLVIDIDIKPRGLYTFDHLPLEVYAAIPIGITIPSLKDSAFDSSVGWNVGFGAGATWFFTNMVGVNLEAMWLLHYFGSDVKGGADADTRLSQFNFLANVVVAL